MDPTPFAGYYSALPSLAPGMRYPYPATTATGATGRGMIFYPQPMSVESIESLEAQDLELDHPDPSGSPGPNSSGGPKRPMDKKLRRQIANSNERRRMQSINQGFHQLRLLMPHLQGEKLSKASVLQHAGEHIYRLGQERDRLIQQNTSLRMMLSKYWSSSDRSSLSSTDVLSENKVNKATSPLSFDDEKAAARELEQIFASQKELQKLKSELEQERSMRLALEARCPPLKDRTPSEEEDEIEESEMSDQEVTYRSKRPCTDSSPRNNLDIIVRAIRQIEGDAFSRSATPTCSADRHGTFRPISVSTDSSRVSPVTPVCAS